jgi:hypothetical protein
MRSRWMSCCVIPMLATGCSPLAALPDESATQQVAAAPFTEPRTTIAPTRVNYAPASPAVDASVEMIGRKLYLDNRQAGLPWPYFNAIGSADPEIFHVGSNRIFVTEGLIKQCQSDGQLAAVLAYEMGRIVSEREAAANDQVRNPERPLPIHLPIAGSYNSRDADPTYLIEMARYEKQYPKHPAKLPPPNPQLVANDFLQRSGYQITDLTAVMPILQNAQRFTTQEDQFKGTVKQGDWLKP